MEATGEEGPPCVRRVGCGARDDSNVGREMIPNKECHSRGNAMSLTLDPLAGEEEVGHTARPESAAVYISQTDKMEVSIRAH